MTNEGWLKMTGARKLSSKITTEKGLKYNEEEKLLSLI